MRVESSQGAPAERQASIGDDVEPGESQDLGQERSVDQQGTEHEERCPEDDLCADADLLWGDLARFDLMFFFVREKKEK